MSGRVVTPVASLSLKGRALRLLSQREHARAELVRKLTPHETSEGELARVLDELQAKGFLNETRVVESLVHRRAPKLGAARVRQELLAKGLSGQEVTDAVAALQATEFDRAREVWLRKFGEPATDAAAYGKQMRFLVSRGFAPDVVRRVLKA